jgi:hypothetical protein
MKKQLVNPTLALTGAVAAILFTGCASNPGYSDLTGPPSALAFTTVTNPRELTKWTQDRYLMMSLRGIDTYYFQVPDSGYRPGGVAEVVTPAPSTVIANPDGTVTEVTPPAGVGAAPGPYQTGTRSYKVIEYRPGHAR